MRIHFRKMVTLALGAMAISPILARAVETGAFTLVQPMSQFRRFHTATLLANGNVLVAGGAPFAPAAVAEVYDPAAQSWTNSGALKTGREFHTATLLQDGRVVVTGGQSGNQLLGSTEVYDLN